MSIQKTKSRNMIFVVAVSIIIATAISACSKSDVPNRNIITDNIFIDNKELTDDLMTLNNGNQVVRFYIGSFSDTYNFSKTAQRSLEELRDGKISYWIYPSKDMSRYLAIEILPFASMLPGAHTVGPVIFQLGSQSPRYGTRPEDNDIIVDWQDAAEVLKVALTPEAEIATTKLLHIISLGPITKVDDEFYAADYKFTDDEVKDLVEFGILVRESPFVDIEIAADYNRVMSLYAH